MIQVFSAAVLVFICIAGLAAIASLGAAIGRKWQLCRSLARTALLTAFAVVPAGVMILIGALSLRSGDDATSKATMLARGISEGMNLTAMVLPFVVIASIAWLIADWRIRGDEQSATDTARLARTRGKSSSAFDASGSSGASPLTPSHGERTGGDHAGGSWFGSDSDSSSRGDADSSGDYTGDGGGFDGGGGGSGD